VSISSNGYVCLGNNSDCGSNDFLVGLNYNLDPTRDGSGQIYFKSLDSNFADFTSIKIYLKLFNPDFEPHQILMITYDNVLPHSFDSNSVTSFQIYLSTDAVNSFVIFKFKSCPLNYYTSSGPVYKNIDERFREVIITNGQQCIGSNVEQTGVWVSEVTSKGKISTFFYF
jgi:hypothetical protein